jgi:hypothetical protein
MERREIDKVFEISLLIAAVIASNNDGNFKFTTYGLGAILKRLRLKGDIISRRVFNGKERADQLKPKLVELAFKHSDKNTVQNLLTQLVGFYTSNPKPEKKEAKPGKDLRLLASSLPLYPTL